jgi:polyribonucleotide 5'-hydroxyl-kinase
MYKNLGALLVERPSGVDEGFSQQAPLVYHYGHKTPGENTILFNTLVSRLAEVTMERMSANKKGWKNQFFIWLQNLIKI